jgi:predicted metal-binding protein
MCRYHLHSYDAFNKQISSHNDILLVKNHIKQTADYKLYEKTI